jgi:urea transport system ATP-binding protein
LTTILTLKNVDVFYGKSHICHKVNLEVNPGETVCLLGRNGVGKTTLLRSVVGLTPHRAGTILFKGQNICQKLCYEIARLGIGYVPQGRQIFSNLTVAENLRSGTIIKYQKFGPISGEVLDYFPVLRERLKQAGGTLSGGEQQMLAIARALVGEPSLLLLDEPSEGIQPTIVQAIRDIVLTINRERRISILLVEQNLKFALAVAQRGYVMDKGHIVGQGDVETIAGDRIIQGHLTFSNEQ